jgi:hypothetical protein
MTARRDEFESFLRSLDKYTLLSLASLLGVTFVLDYLFSLQPPWPRHSTYITAFLELSTVFLAFFVTVKTKRNLLRIQVATFALIVLTFCAYFLLYSMFVFETPLTGERVIAGYECTVEARHYVAPALKETCPFLSEEALAAAQYDAETVWTPSSVRLVEVAMFGAWSFFFIFTTFLFGISIAFLQRNQRRTASATS